MPQKISLEYIQEQSKNLGFICISKQYKGSKYKLAFKCSHDHIFRMTWYRFYKMQCCKKCLRGYQERFVRLVVEQLFDNEFLKIRPNWLKYPKTNRNLELDMYNESLHLAFEYNGKQHYQTMRRFRVTKKKLLEQQQRDLYKNLICKDCKITLITIPQLYDMLDPYDIKEYIEGELNKFGYILPESFVKAQLDIDKLLRIAKNQ